MFRIVNINFTPQDDQSEFDVSLRAPEGTSLEATEVPLLFLFLVFALIRAIFFRGGPGRGWGGGWGPGWGPGDRDARHRYWESRFGEGFDEWHRRSHERGSSNEPPASNTSSTPV
jgi:hypothetical protein